MTASTVELLAIQKKIEDLSPPNRLRLAALLIENGKYELAEAILEGVLGALVVLRNKGNPND